MGCLDHIRHCQEFDRRNFRLCHEQPNLFHESQWPLPPIVYLLFRWLTASYLVGVKILTLVVGWGGGRHFIFLTNWTYLVLAISFLVRAVNATIYHVREQKHDKGEITQQSQAGLPWCVCCQWVLHNLATAISLLVTCVYWIALYHGHGIRFVNFNVHAINSVIVMTDLAVTATPVRLFHLYQPMIYVVVYGVFSIVYWAAGGTDLFGNHYVYNVLDWGGNLKLAAILSVCLVFVAVPLIHSLVFGLYKLRVFVFKKIFPFSTFLQLRQSEVALSVVDASTG